ncbi:uncharacterized protein A1O9_01436 [Exophiala aquamarina CBS 119918]|uniref:Uncharacterized protein n=1 Tax=Exophiala aquamarina CBS 119918 TaxID=1182545 RepID=A0A072PVT4_9EURO|nr:uncharacterized protein A1O9_01436 [Exophiala aquamarina CBS 119918]KEF63458.1 hypothetical protein A1O9_01436 [Exophiala aquamarina CBS 119918]
MRPQSCVVGSNCMWNTDGSIPEKRAPFTSGITSSLGA